MSFTSSFQLLTAVDIGHGQGEQDKERENGYNIEHERPPRQMRSGIARSQPIGASNNTDLGNAFISEPQELIEAAATIESP